MVKNEEDIIEMTLRHFLAEGLDHIFIYDNLSNDKTPEILDMLSNEFDNLHVFEDSEVAYYQAMKMNEWINNHSDNRDWIIPFDADEIWETNINLSLADYIREVDFHGKDCIEAPVWDMIPNIDHETDRPARNILWRSPYLELFPVVAYRHFYGQTYLHQGAHGVDGVYSKVRGEVEVCHFQYRSFKQYCNKLHQGKVAYDATDLDYGIGYHWREGGKKSREELTVEWEKFCSQTKVVSPCYPKGQIYGT